jgi:hypothetical protein
MNQATQPVKGRGTVLTAVATAVAVCASLALAPMASAAANPVAAGSTTTITLNSGFSSKLKKSKVKLTGVTPATVKGKAVTLPIEEGTLAVTGQGELVQEGGLKFKAGKKSTSVTKLVLNTTTSSLTAKVGGKNMKFASVTGLTATRNGFGTTVNITSLKLTGKAATELNKKLGFSGKSKKKGKRASASKAKAPAAPFKGNQVLGRSTTETQPKTLGVLATGSTTLALSPSSLKKLAHVGVPPYLEGASPVEVKLEPVAPTQVVSLSPVTAAFPLGEGSTIAPNASAGVVHTVGGLKLVQNLEAVTGKPGNITTLTMGNIWVDLATRVATVEVSIANPVTPEANLGSFGRASIADVSLTGATIKSDPAAHTVTVENASATLQATTAEILNKVFIEGLEKSGFPPQEKFAASDPLGTFSFTATTE